MGPALKELRDGSLVVDDMFGEGIARGTVEYHGTPEYHGMANWPGGFRAVPAPRCRMYRYSYRGVYALIAQGSIIELFRAHMYMY